ncbi:MAG: LacI family transcriptional regulator [Bradyrhizobium sp.]|jgi:LacI family transcriptional regulator|uniref:LacI family DNA-binding transcriptional regulator n=1 Tax=Bradyrhizobium sp. TaxID=376 RepID=UPI0011FD8055|nr:LacI family DNA-binding transcriptional regulator [Bradyrhizobium sp.]THD47625.1 MAG: LacI family transcriptional regulator [Bradyrhizobium sp.]
MVHKTGTGRTTKQAFSSRPTIKDVAAKCGVHPSTVSRALSPAMSHLVAPDVAKRIRAAAAALGYQVNVAAAGLRTGRSGLIGVLAPDIADPGFPPILSGVTETLGAEGYATIVVDVGTDCSREQEIVDRLIARGVDGLVLATVTLNDPVVGHCLAASIPVVLVNRTDAGRRLSAVVTDDEAGMRLAVEHLVGLGHIRIGHIAGPQNVSTGALRRAGFKAAAARAGLSAHSIMIEISRAYTREEGRLAALRLLDRKLAPTAIVAANDLLALGIYDALSERGLNCPADVSVVGHNDMPYVDMLSPPLTTVRIAQRKMGNQAARLLLDQIADPTAHRKRLVLEPSLIVRTSTVPPKR